MRLVRMRENNLSGLLSAAKHQLGAGMNNTPINPGVGRATILVGAD